MSDEEKIQAIIEAVGDALSELADEMPFTTGNVMDALFTIIIESAKASPNHDPAIFVQMMRAHLREHGMELQ